MDELLPIIGSKSREMLECVGVNIWLVQGDGRLLLMHQAGTDPTTSQGMTQGAGEGVAGDVSENGEAILVESPKDERLIHRNGELEDGRVESIIAAPLIDKGCLVGVVEAVTRVDGKPFDDDDLFVLTSLNREQPAFSSTTPVCCWLERKVEVLEMLVTGSAAEDQLPTLNLERMLQTIVNAPQALHPVRARDRTATWRAVQDSLQCLG